MKQIRDFEPGAAILTVDHVSKGNDRGRHLIGSQHKGAGLDGPLFTVERVIEPFGRGLIGRAEIVISKDRPGYVRAHCGPINSNRQQKFGDFVLDSTGPTIEAYIEPWDLTTAAHTSSADAERDVKVYEFIERYFDTTGEGASGNKIRLGVTGKNEAIDASVIRLFMNGNIRKMDATRYAPTDPPKPPRLVGAFTTGGGTT
jgi:hypothetical protein